jgi:hypothetical protein
LGSKKGKVRVLELVLTRIKFTEKSSQGEITHNFHWYCFTLEDTVREIKIPGKTAIPEGKYQIIINESKRFKRLMPLLLNVPNFEGIRIHWGNTSEDTEGCILVGLSRSPDFVGQSRLAFNRLFDLFEETLKTEELWLTITSHREDS